MKKFLPFVLVFIVLAGAGWYFRSKNASAPIREKQAGESALSEMVAPGGAVNSIKDAMGLGKKMKCTYAAPDNNGKQGSSIIIVDGEKYKFTVEANGEKSYGIFDGETQYMWSVVTKQGLKMTKACIDELSKSVPTDGKNNSFATPETPQDFEKSFGEAQGVSCEPSNEDFSIPTDVKFIDQCEMMRESLKALEGVKGNLPAGVNIPGY